MSLNRYAAQRDRNEALIVEGLRKAGYRVQPLSGTGVPDLMVGRGQAIWLLEVKSHGGRLRPAQKAFGEAWPVAVVRTLEEALEAVR